MACVSKRLVQSLADFPQTQTFKVKQGERFSLDRGQLCKRFLQLRPIELRGNLAIQIGLSRQSIIQRIEICTGVKAAASQVRLSIQSAMESNLQDPIFHAALRAVKEHRLLVEVEKYFLHYVLRFPSVAHDPSRDTQHKPGVTVKQDL
jgi:hypothetical protein